MPDSLVFVICILAIFFACISIVWLFERRAYLKQKEDYSKFLQTGDDYHFMKKDKAMINFIYPKKKVSDSILRVCADMQCANQKTGEIYHNSIAFLISYKGMNIAYSPFGNGHFIEVKESEGFILYYNFTYVGSIFELCRTLNKLKKDKKQ